MRISRYFALALFCLLAVACSKDENSNNPVGDNDTNPSGSFVRCTISGPGVDNKTFSETPLHTHYTVVYYYDEEEDFSAVSFIGGNNLTMTAAFPGQATGTYTIGEDSEEGSNVTLGFDSDGEGSFTQMVSRSGTLTITEIVPEQSRVRGTFSGSFMTLNGSTYTVTNGEFLLAKK